jgi:TldD protein
MGHAPTGNGRRQSYATCPRPDDQHRDAGRSDKVADMLSSTSAGSTPVNFGGGQVDITNGKFVFQCTEAYLIETAG